jgi:hypothetical protein
MACTLDKDQHMTKTTNDIIFASDNTETTIETIDAQLDEVHGGHGDAGPFPMGPDTPQPQRTLGTIGNIGVAAGLAGAGALLGPAQQLKWKLLGYPGK